MKEKHPISGTRLNVRAHQQLGLGFTVDWWREVSFNEEPHYSPWPEPHTDVVQVERCRWIFQLRLMLVAWAVRITIPLWDCTELTS